LHFIEFFVSLVFGFSFSCQKWIFYYWNFLVNENDTGMLFLISPGRAVDR